MITANAAQPLRRRLPPPRPRSGARVSLVGWIEDLQAHGFSSFSTAEAQQTLGSSEANVQVGLSRLTRKGQLIRPVKGLYVIVAPEHRAIGGPPPLWYIDAVMQHLGMRYYVGLLRAAALHGASQQAPQELQVISDAQRRVRTVGRGRIRWVTKMDVASAAVQQMVTPTGTITVSSPEVTAADLVRYPQHAGYWDNIATVLADLGARLDAERLAVAVRNDHVTARRLGYLLDLVGHHHQADRLRAELETPGTRIYPLDPSQLIRGAPIDERWHLAINTSVDPDY